MKLWFDLETFSDVPISFGVYRYAEKARILLCAYAVDDAPARCVDCAALEPMPADFTAALKNPACEIWAHNSNFDRNILAHYPGCAEAARDISRKASKLHKNAYIHIALDTGMGRIGFLPTEESLEEIRKISEMPNIVIEGLFTHFARADETDLAPALIQFERYQTFSEKIRALGIDIPIRHVSNSAGIIRFREANLNMVRAGITIYGLYPSDEVEKDIVPIRPVMSLVSHISYVKTLPAGYSISYGGTFTTQRESRVATIPVGYADGYPRQLSGKASVLIRGKRAPILGRVCMDQFMVDVTDIPDAQRGDEVVLVGTQGDEHITVEELGAISGRFNYEFVCNISPRVPRCYVNRG